jgi:hypothetical protein
VSSGTTFNFRSAVLVALMLAALVAAAAGAIQRMVPGWQPLFLVAVCFLIGLEAGIVHYVARSQRLTLTELMRYLAPELFVMAVVMRVIASLGVAEEPLAASLTRWLYDPLAVFDAAFGAHMVAGLLIGALAHLAMRDLSALAPLPRLSGDEYRRLEALVAIDRSLALGRIGSRFVLGGALLLLALAGETVNPTVIGGPPQPLAPLSVVASLVYVVSGFVLYSRARLMVLQAKWTQEGAHVAPLVEQRWIRSSWLLIALIAAGAASLPRSYALGLPDTLRALLGIFGYALAMIGYALMWLLALLLSLPAWLLSIFAPAGTPVAAAPPPPPAAPPQVEHVPNLLAALVFWFCMLLLVGYAVAVVVRRHPALIQRIGVLALIETLLAWLRSIWRWSASWATLAVRAVNEALRRPAAAPQRSRGHIGLRRLAPRDQVRYFYLATLRRAAHSGMARLPAQTPYEYAARLEHVLPESASDVTALTDAFIVAQYSPYTLTPDDVERARHPWKRLRRTLRTRHSTRTREVPNVDDPT